ncbi:hypothetical protein [Kitasatospora sp. NPDC093679]|uniref:hypothetical protein n=1 Tax=Kitasatospora sp. NPDC093679 TaxID=3154983 RepID=UPI00342805CC
MASGTTGGVGLGEDTGLAPGDGGADTDGEDGAEGDGEPDGAGSGEPDVPAAPGVRGVPVRGLGVPVAPPPVAREGSRAGVPPVKSV